ncbi:hypothetical protein M8998_10670 [Sphingobacterium sp. lm-10]|uniref:BT0820 family HAD-type phosphatase n=1 Tax=Sphingobacterium sp. lm-10 TaxID=2944904 RepID=UPI00202293E8|nr:hypothetical protein [Sphingobacterium sp. lm-10]MCL7988402.1 hypothetical protein [Sphingobacterium sp. lm-10]
MIIAVDFDGTIVEHRYPQIGKPIPFAIDVLIKLREERHTLILWTVREGALLQEAIDYCAERGVIFYAHNANFPEEDPAQASRKLTADLFIDDRNLGGLPDWTAMYRAIAAMRQGGQDVTAILYGSPENPIAKKRKRGFFSTLFGDN